VKVLVILVTATLTMNTNSKVFLQQLSRVDTISKFIKLEATSIDLKILFFNFMLGHTSNTTSLTPWLPLGFSDFRKKTAVFGCLTNALAPSPIALESCSTAQTDQPV